MNDCDPPFTCAMARVRPWVGRTEPVERGIQSIWFLKTAVWRRNICGQPSREGEGHAGREHSYQVAVLLRADPYVAIAPFAQLAKLLDLGVVVLRVVLDWKSRGVIHADVASKSEENARGFIGQKLGK